MSSIKDRIAALNKQSPQASPAPVPASVRPKRSTVGDINSSINSERADPVSADKSSTNDIPPSNLSVKERMALLQANSAKPKEPAVSPLERPKRATVSDIRVTQPPSTTSADEGNSTLAAAEGKTTGTLTVKERLALMKSQGSQDAIPTPVADHTATKVPGKIGGQLAASGSAASQANDAGSGNETCVERVPVPPRRSSKLDPALLGKVNIGALMPGGPRPSFTLPSVGPPSTSSSRARSSSASDATGEMVHTTLTRPRRESKPRSRPASAFGAGEGSLGLVETISDPLGKSVERPLSMPNMKASLESGCAEDESRNKSEAGQSDTENEATTCEGKEDGGGAAGDSRLVKPAGVTGDEGDVAGDSRLVKPAEVTGDEEDAAGDSGLVNPAEVTGDEGDAAGDSGLINSAESQSSEVSGTTKEGAGCTEGKGDGPADGEGGVEGDKNS